MFKQLIVLLDTKTISYCYYEVGERESSAIPLDTLKAGIIFAMKENLSVQFVYPDYKLPQEYEQLISSIDCVRIKPISMADDYTDVAIIDGWDKKLLEKSYSQPIAYVMRLKKNDFFENISPILETLKKNNRINFTICDVDTFTKEDFARYQDCLQTTVNVLSEAASKGSCPQTNILTDRLLLKSMNNCNAGVENVTLAPNGNFYVCPAFYYAGECNGTERYQNEVCQKGYNIGSVWTGIDLKNPQLYQIDNAPICSHCDAFHCKRCIWLNRKTTLEVNTPSHEQCVAAHLERNASKKLLDALKEQGHIPSEIMIDEIDYLDPFEKRKEWYQ